MAKSILEKLEQQIKLNEIPQHENSSQPHFYSDFLNIYKGQSKSLLTSDLPLMQILDTHTAISQITQ